MRKKIPDAAVVGTQIDARDVVHVAYRACPICGAFAVVRLHRDMVAAQTDGTTVVCSPVLGGCNMGFAAPLSPVTGEARREIGELSRRLRGC